MTKLRIIRDMDFFYENIENLNPYKKKLLGDQIFIICKTARRLRNENKISQITCNRVNNLWRFTPSSIPPTIYAKEWMKRFKQPNLIHIKNALDKMFKVLEYENSQSHSKSRNTGVTK